MCSVNVRAAREMVEKRVDELLTALDVIAQFEEGDQYRLKRAIREQIDVLDEQLEEMEQEFAIA